ncbi:hypothetical protein G9A89_008138 [Geosiphon pyriformis]|nr:hypothetical protein G9A89_008138 [Geosiphon pyriformis]
MNYVLLVENSCLMKKYETTFLVEEKLISCLDSYPHDKNEIWQIANAKIKSALFNKILEIKNNPPKLVLPDKIRDIKQHSKNNFKVATTPDTTTLEYYQLIYIHCKQRFNIPDGIEVVKKSVYQYIKNRINNYLFGNYNISEHTIHNEKLKTLTYCEETYPVQSQYSIDFESETETSNKSKQKLKQYSKTTPNTPILPKTTAKHLQTPEQGTKVSPDNKNPFKLTAVNEENDSEISEKESIDSENKEDKMTAYIAKIPEFNREDIETITKAGDANGWNAARMLRTISYFLKGTADKWFENLTTPFNDWTAFKTAFLEQFTDNNTSITLQNYFRNIK